MDKIDLTVYLVGMTEDQARESMIWTEYKDAEEHNLDEFGGDANIYSVNATIDFTTIKPE